MYIFSNKNRLDQSYNTYFRPYLIHRIIVSDLFNSKHDYETIIASPNQDKALKAKKRFNEIKRALATTDSHAEANTERRRIIEMGNRLVSAQVSGNKGRVATALATWRRL